MFLIVVTLYRWIGGSGVAVATLPDAASGSVAASGFTGRTMTSTRLPTWLFNSSTSTPGSKPVVASMTYDVVRADVPVAPGSADAVGAAPTAEALTNVNSPDASAVARRHPRNAKTLCAGSAEAVPGP